MEADFVPALVTPAAMVNEPDESVLPFSCFSHQLYPIRIGSDGACYTFSANPNLRAWGDSSPQVLIDRNIQTTPYLITTSPSGICRKNIVNKHTRNRRLPSPLSTQGNPQLGSGT
jgi:hypothetical protein